MSDGTGQRCVQVRWPFGWTATTEQAYVRDLWHGSLLESKRDGSGLLFRRHRYVDPASGRFTQEDPIGLAGGLNLYGFAAGDPVNFADPYGLCPLEVDGIPCTLILAGQGALGGAATGGLLGAAGATLVVPGVGTTVGAAGGAIAGGVAGLGAGAIVGAARDLSSALQMSGLGDKLSDAAGKAKQWIKVVVVGGLLAPGESTTGTSGMTLPVPAGAEKPAKPDEKKNAPKQPPEP